MDQSVFFFGRVRRPVFVTLFFVIIFYCTLFVIHFGYTSWFTIVRSVFFYIFFMIIINMVIYYY